MPARREKWVNSELRSMVHFMHDFLKGRFDNYFKDSIERETAKLHPSGNTVWSYLLRLQESYDGWSLDQVGHSIISCQSKWSKHLQTHLHEVERVPAEEVLFVYRKLGIKLNDETCQRVTSQYSGYELIWRRGVLKDCKKKATLNVKKESQGRKRETVSNSGEATTEDEEGSDEEREDEVKGGSYEVVTSSDEAMNEQTNDVVSQSSGETMTDRVIEKRRGKKTAKIVKKVKKEEPSNAKKEKKRDVKPTRRALGRARNQTGSGPAPSGPAPSGTSRGPPESNWPDAEMVDGAATAVDAQSRPRDTVAEMEIDFEDGGGWIRAEKEAERRDNAAAADAATPLAPAAPAATAATPAPTNPIAAANVVETPKSRNKEEVSGTNEDRHSRAVAAARLLLNGRPTPAALVAQRDRPVQQGGAAAAAARVPIGAKRSMARRSALMQAAADAFQPEDKKRPITEKEKEDEMDTTEKEKIDEMYITKKKKDDEMGVAAAAAAAAVVPAAASAVQPSARENLLARMKRTKKEGWAGRLKNILSSANRFKMMCEGRAAAATSLACQEEMTFALWSELHDWVGEDDEDEKKKRLWCANGVAEIGQQEDPEVRETMRREMAGKLFGELVADRLVEEVFDALEDESTWE